MQKIISLKGVSDEKIKKFVIILIFSGIPILLLIGFVIVSAHFFNANTINNSYLLIFLQQSLPMLLAFVLIPIVIYKKTMKINMAEIGVKFPENKIAKAIDLFMITGFSIVLVINSNISNEIIGALVFHFIFVAITEEFLFRGIIMHSIKDISGKTWISVIVSSLIFSFVFHSQGDIFINLIIRFPIGVIMGIMRVKTNSLATPIIVHWIYNSTLTII
jgi:membrane protease YdiL (CAAX protease family)